MRDEFRAIVSGWTMHLDELDERIEETARYAAEHSLQPDEEATVKFMIRTQIARGISAGDFDDTGIPRAVLLEGLKDA